MSHCRDSEGGNKDAVTAEDQELADDAIGFDDMIDSVLAVNTPQTSGGVSTRRKKRRKAVRMPDYILNDPDMRKYWAQRYRIFSRFDNGIMMDKGKYDALHCCRRVFDGDALSCLRGYRVGSRDTAICCLVIVMLLVTQSI